MDAAHVPHFDVMALDGRRVRYAEVWQRRNLVLACLPHAAAGAARWLEEVHEHDRELERLETTFVATADGVPGVPCPGLIIADRWGEVMHRDTPSDVSGLMAVDDLLEWVRYVQYKCPECEGEAR